MSAVVFFKKKKLNPPKRVCFCLKEARERAGMTLEEISVKTKIDRKNLQALEQCRFSDLPEAVIYQKNFVRSYVEALGLDAKPFLTQYHAEEETKKKFRHPYKIIKFNPLSNLPMILRVVLSIVVVAILVGYLSVQVKRIVDPPELLLDQPLDGLITMNDNIIVQGKTEKEVTVAINGKEIGVNEQGLFEERVDLKDGVNTLVVSAKKKHGKVTEITRHVVHK